MAEIVKNLEYRYIPKYSRDINTSNPDCEDCPYCCNGNCIVPPKQDITEDINNLKQLLLDILNK